MTIINDILTRFSGYPVFTYRDVKLYLNGRIDDNSLRELISYMASKKKLYLIRKSHYTLEKDELLSGYLFEPFYYGMHFAMTCREIWSQLTHVCVITTKNVKRNKVKLFNDSDFWADVHHIPPKYFFGFSTVLYNNRKIPVSDPEKTLIDFVYFRTRISTDDYALLCKALDKQKLLSYLSFYDAKTSKTVMKIYEKYSKLEESRY